MRGAALAISERMVRITSAQRSETRRQETFPPNLTPMPVLQTKKPPRGRFGAFQVAGSALGRSAHLDRAQAFHPERTSAVFQAALHP